MLTKGKLWVFEGPDGVGKSTLAQSTAAYLNTHGHACDYLAFPGREAGTLGLHVYELHHDPHKFGIERLHSTSLQVLHIAAHMDAIEQRILPALKEGRHVVLDRFWWSTWVYGLVSGVERVTLETMLALEHTYWKDTLPNRIFLIVRSAPLRADEPRQWWNARRAAYDELARAQQRVCPVQHVHNDQAIPIALAHIFQSVEADLSRITGSSPQPVATSVQGVTVGEVQLPLEGTSREESVELQSLGPDMWLRLAPVKPTEVFNTYWRFAAERQHIFFQRLQGTPSPWTHDVILMKYKFTNAYRASDRVSQYLIKEVIYQGDQTPEEVFFRTILFKIFNHIETWRLLQAQIGAVSWAEYQFDQYDSVLTQALQNGTTIFSAAYIMPSGSTTFRHPKKHRNYLQLLDLMMTDEVPQRISEARSMREVFELLRSYPLIGDFLAYQYATDLNYSELTHFSEMEFVVPGPGARDGIRKCFDHLGGLSETDIIRLMAERQHEEFVHLDIPFQSLWGRPLQLIDCQNLFCEVAKYARLAHPHIKGVGGRTRIKQMYRVTPQAIAYWYPPKWHLNQLIHPAEAM